MSRSFRRDNVSGTVYLLCFARTGKLADRAAHYLGWTESADVTSRLATHRAGSGARIVRAALLAGLDFSLVRTWTGPTATRAFEKQLKRRKEAAMLCPVCRAERSERKNRLRNERRARARAGAVAAESDRQFQQQRWVDSLSLPY